MTHRRPIPALFASVVLLLLPCAVSAQSPRNHDGRQSRWTIYSTKVTNGDDFTFARVNSLTVGAMVRLRNTSLRFGAQEVKRYPHGTIVSPIREHAVTFTVILH